MSKQSFSTVVRCYNQFNEIIESKILDSTTRGGATRKANSWLKDTFFQPTKKFTIDNYQYWNCYDIAQENKNELSG